MKLLDVFTPSLPELGLSELARLAGRDKATTHRLLSELADMGFVEQAKRSKLYRLGPAVLRLANIREQSFPVKKATARHLENLVEAVRETAHITALQGAVLTTVDSRYSQHHTTRVHMDLTEVLPLHATASGYAVMGFSAAPLLENTLNTPLIQHTNTTLTDPDLIRHKVAQARNSGFGHSDGEYEAGVSSIAAPLFGAENDCIGAVAVACPEARMTDDQQARIQQHLASAASAITKAWGGVIPANLNHIWNTL